MPWMNPNQSMQTAQFSKCLQNISKDVGPALPTISEILADSHFLPCQIVFSEGYKEDNIASLDDPFPVTEDASTEEYDYLSDSDLDDEELVTETGNHKNDATRGITRDGNEMEVSPR